MVFWKNPYIAQSTVVTSFASDFKEASDKFLHLWYHNISVFSPDFINPRGYSLLGFFLLAEVSHHSLFSMTESQLVGVPVGIFFTGDSR